MEQRIQFNEQIDKFITETFSMSDDGNKTTYWCQQSFTRENDWPIGQYETKVHEEIPNTLPSQFQIGDLVSLKFSHLTIPKAQVIKVHFTDNKVQYDLSVHLDDVGEARTRIYNVDSLIVEPI